MKYTFDPALFEALCPLMKATIPGFDCRSFIYDVFDNQWPDLEFEQRVRHVAMALHRQMPSNFPEAAPIVVALSRRLGQEGVTGLPTIFLVDYVHLRGASHPDLAIRTIDEVRARLGCGFGARSNQRNITKPAFQLSAES